MELVKSIIKRYSTILAVDLTTSIGLAYSWNKGYKYTASTASLCCIGGTYIYCRMKSRDRISSNQAIVVTGCDSGLGYSLALHCRQLGATVIAGVLRNDGPGAKKLKEQNVFVYPLDITKSNSVVDFVDSVRTILTQKNLGLRCLINNAAVMIFGEFEWQTEEQIRSQVEVNFLGTMRITRELMPMIRAHSSRIIVISSHCNMQPIPGVAVYSGTKAAITAWATAIRVELRKYGVKVVCFVPGSFVKESNILARQAEHFEAMRKSMPLEAKNFYDDYFTRYSQYFSSVTQSENYDKLQDPRIYEIFEGALLDKHPLAFYKHESWRYSFYHALFLVTPTRMRDWLVQKFVQGPPWTKRLDEAPNADASLPLERNISDPRDSKIVSENSDSPASGKKMADNRESEK